jgi:hypothetical protein
LELGCFANNLNQTVFPPKSGHTKTREIFKKKIDKEKPLYKTIHRMFDLVGINPRNKRSIPNAVVECFIGIEVEV